MDARKRRKLRTLLEMYRAQNHRQKQPCRIDVVGAWNVFYHVPFVTPIAKFFGAKFVRQDQVTMIRQAQGLRHNPSLMLIDDADKPAKWYFALKQARLDGSGKHPMDGPVELHWRS